MYQLISNIDHYNFLIKVKIIFYNDLYIDFYKFI